MNEVAKLLDEMYSHIELTHGIPKSLLHEIYGEQNPYNEKSTDSEHFLETEDPGYEDKCSDIDEKERVEETEKDWNDDGFGNKVLKDYDKNE